MADQLEALRGRTEFLCERIDVDADETLRTRYHHRVPVLENAEGQLLCEVFLDPAQVLNYLQGA
jgi:hypothetical protein